MPPTVEDRPTDCVKVCESVALARLLWHPLRIRKLAVQVATLGVLCRVRPSIPLHERMHGQVVMRCRPFSGSETMRKCQSVVDIDSVSSQARPSPRGGDDATGSALLPIGNVRLC